VSDDKIKQLIIDQLYWDSRVDDPSNISVEFSKGKATLSGAVRSFPALQAAVLSVSEISGVSKVENQLKVENHPEAERQPDEEIHRNIRTGLSWNPGIDEKDIDASVENGHVSLAGTVDAFWKKQAVEDLITNVGGVFSVSNRIDVAPQEDIIDNSLAESVIAALDRNVGVDAGAMEVTVKDKVVTLSGNVSSLLERWAAERIARYTDGVIEVYNRLTVG
jgi:osmotically-inducible protein OsmY